MFNSHTSNGYIDLPSLLKATRSSVKDTGEFQKLIPDVKKEVPTWDCNGGVCVLEWKPKKTDD